MAHHAWVRQWRDKTGGTLAAGREAWKLLDSKLKWQFKIDFTNESMSQVKSESKIPAESVKNTRHASKLSTKAASSKGLKKSMERAQSDGTAKRNVDGMVGRPVTPTRQKTHSAFTSTRTAKQKPKSMKRI